MVHLWLVDLSVTDVAGRTSAPAEPKLLTAGDAFSVGDFSFSPMVLGSLSAHSEIPI